MARPRSISLSSTSSDDVQELSPEEVARLASRPGRPRQRQRAARDRPLDSEVIVISDSDSPVRNPPSLQTRLTRANLARSPRANPHAPSNANPSDRRIRYQERFRRLQEEEERLRRLRQRNAEIMARQEQLLEAIPFYAALQIGVGPRPAIRRQALRGSAFARRGGAAPYDPEPPSGRALLHRFLLMPHVNDATFDAMSYDDLLELGRRVGDVRSRGADAKKIAKLRKRKWARIKGTLPTTSEPEGCPICIEDFIDADDCTILSCKHIFHAGCSEQWLKVNATCPVCRASLDGSPATA